MFQLFADDTSLFLALSKVNFRAALETISIFERNLGAWLNIEKSTNLQLDEGPQPDWFSATGCKDSQPGEILSYLGCPVGVKLPATKEAKFLLDKVRKCVNHFGVTACYQCKVGLCLSATFFVQF